MEQDKHKTRSQLIKELTRLRARAAELERKFHSSQERETGQEDSQTELILLLEERVKARTAELVALNAHLQAEIRERERAEHALRESELRFRQLAENINLIFTLRTSEKLLYASPAYERITGRSLANYYENPDVFLEYIHPDDRERITRIHYSDEVNQTGIVNTEYRIIRPDGAIRWLRVRAVPVLNEQEYSGFRAGFTEDITERKQIEEQLLKSEREKSAILNATSDMVAYYYDNSLMIQWANQSSADSVGMTVDQLVGRHCYEIWNHRPQPCDACPVLRAFDTGMPQSMEKTTLDGRIWAIHGFPVFDESDQMVGVVEFGQNITAQKHAQHALQQAKERAESANRTKSEFLANMSHELRTPLNAILGYTQLLKHEDNLTEKQQQAIETIHTSSEHLLDLITDILDFSKMEARKIRPEPIEFHLRTFLKTLIDIQQMKASQKGLGFSYECSPDVPDVIRSDKKFLRQILLNLLSNAIKFTEHGYLCFSVRTVEPDRLAVESERKDAASLSLSHCRLRFSIEDSGRGIAPEDLERIFQPFEQVHSLHYHTEGTGLGLTISQKLVRLMGSELHVSSAVGKGSCFWFELDAPVIALDGHCIPGEQESRSRILAEIEHTLVPPLKELQELHRLAIRGNLKEILCALEALEQKHHEYAPFFQPIRQWLSGFQIQHIRRYLKTCLEEKE